MFMRNAEPVSVWQSVQWQMVSAVGGGDGAHRDKAERLAELLTLSLRAAGQAVDCGAAFHQYER
jgi:hypothetical protein